MHWTKSKSFTEGYTHYMTVGITSQLQLRTYIYIYTCIKLLVYVKDLVLVKRASVKENFLANQTFLTFIIIRVV